MTPPPPKKKKLGHYHDGKESVMCLLFIKVKFLMSDVRVCPVLYLFGLRDYATVKKWDV
jgi:hypothetical protein